MKIKEVADRLQITQKTIRYYEEQEIISPEMEEKNGRNFREYTEEDVKKLEMTVELRKLSFTVKEIQRIFQCPESLERIYLEKIEQLKRQLEYDGFLLEVFRGVRIDRGDQADDFVRKVTESRRNAALKNDNWQTICQGLDETFDDSKFAKWEKRQVELRNASDFMFALTTSARMKHIMSGDLPW